MGGFDPPNRIQRTAHKFSLQTRYRVGVLGGGIGTDCKGRFPFADRNFPYYTNMSEDTKTKEE
jgi:hypothetical protein